MDKGLKHELNVGDKVKSVIGGPIMMIQELKERGTALCIWFNEDSELQSEDIQLDMLEFHETKENQ